jgi:hypothetical protein
LAKFNSGGQLIRSATETYSPGDLYFDQLTEANLLRHDHYNSAWMMMSF